MYAVDDIPDRGVEVRLRKRHGYGSVCSAKHGTSRFIYRGMDVQLQKNDVIEGSGAVSDSDKIGRAHV